MRHIVTRQHYNETLTLNQTLTITLTLKVAVINGVIKRRHQNKVALNVINQSYFREVGGVIRGEADTTDRSSSKRS